jgi:hypothetical protein
MCIASIKFVAHGRNENANGELPERVRSNKNTPPREVASTQEPWLEVTGSPQLPARLAAEAAPLC